ncbi:MAG TPA: flavin reductase family protein [Candidatus Dormibacteraeota bacterium]|nr:flavin reductase family protein [Candidatus Dormibacteraeota bacterium]
MAGRDFIDVMARVPAGVVLVSTRSGDGYKGMTASSLVSMSLDPPLVVLGLDKVSATRSAILEARAFNVSVLTRSQEFIADRFAGRAPAVDSTWTTLPHRLGRNGLPLLDGAAAWLECSVQAIHSAGDHDVCIGEVEAAEMGSGDPLVLWDRQFWTLH